nr:MAG TPA: Nuclease [Bacteriophage sp.]
MQYGHESEHQRALFRWTLIQRGKYPELDLLFHIPNGGSRHPVEAANLKRQGVMAGVPDLFLPVPRADYHGLFIELKTGRGRLSEKQEAWLTALSQQGYAAMVCYGWECAAQEILKYLEMR